MCGTNPSMVHCCVYRVAILTSSHAEFGGMSKRIETAHFFREHVEQAIKLAPNDNVLHHLLGRWCFEVAQLGWVARRAAAALFGEPPTSTVDEVYGCVMKGGWQGGRGSNVN